MQGGVMEKEEMVLFVLALLCIGASSILLPI
jgi:hypothetical protein